MALMMILDWAAFAACMSMVLIKFDLTWIGILGPDDRALERSG